MYVIQWFRGQRDRTICTLKEYGSKGEALAAVALQGKNVSMIRKVAARTYSVKVKS